MGKSGDQRTRMTKQLIRNAFMDLLSRKPIQSISIRELCGIAGINRGTFYTHYKDIYDLLEQIEEEMTREIEKALEPLLSEGNKELTPLKITTEIFRCLKENADLCTVTLGDYGDKSFAVRLLSLGREKCVEAYSRFFALATPGNRVFLCICKCGVYRPFGGMAQRGHGDRGRGDRGHG